MNYIYGALSIIILNIILYFIYQKRYKERKKREIADAKKQYLEQNQKELARQILQDTQELTQQKADVEEQLRKLNEILAEKQSRLELVNSEIECWQQRARTYEETLREGIEKNMLSYEQDRKANLDAQLKLEAEQTKKVMLAEFEQNAAYLTEQANLMKKQIQDAANEIAKYAAKQTAINEAILRQRKLEEERDFFRVCLDAEAMEDIAVLQEAKKNLKKSEIIDKIIYDNYISKSVLEMLKRVLQNTTCSGIYKITCTKTGEAYIGKSTDVKSRWQQHCKSAFNCGTIAQSLLHKKMRQHGIENFTFELIEKVPKDQLSEREKFYIQFYQTKEVGLNERNG